MDARARFYALAVSAALVMAAGVTVSNDAMAQADDVAVHADDVAVQGDEAPVETAEAAAPDEAVERPVPKQKPAAAERTAKADLDQSAVQAVPVIQSPRPTRTSIRAISLPRILGSYR